MQIAKSFDQDFKPGPLSSTVSSVIGMWRSTAKFPADAAYTNLIPWPLRCFFLSPTES